MTLIWSEYHMREIVDERVPPAQALRREAGVSLPDRRSARRRPQPVDRTVELPTEPTPGREFKSFKTVVRTLRNGPRPKVIGEHQIQNGYAAFPHDLRPKCEVTREVVIAKPGHCACGCELIRDAEFDLEGNATGKLTWLCIRCEHATSRNAVDDEGRVGE